MKRPGKPEGQYYLSHQTLDTDHGVILGVTVTPGDVHDSVPYLDHLEQIHRDVLPIQAATADAAYDFPLAHRVLEERESLFMSGRSLLLTEPRRNSSGMPFLMMRRTMLSMPEWERASSEGAVPRRKRCVLGVLGRPRRLPKLSFPGEMFERK